MVLVAVAARLDTVETTVVAEFTTEAPASSVTVTVNRVVVEVP